MDHFTDDGRTYVSAEPCHWGMIPVRIPQREEPIPHPCRKPFQPYPWYEAVARVKVEA